MSLSIKHLSKAQYGAELFNDDCVSLMKKIPDNSVDLIYASHIIEYFNKQMIEKDKIIALITLF